MKAKRRPAERRLTVLAVLLVVVLGVGAAALDRAQAAQVLGRASPFFVLLALAFTAVSYACLSYSFAAICKLFGVRLGRRDLLEIGFVSWAANHLVASGGAAGYSLRVLLVRRRGLPVGNVLAASFFHSALNNSVLALLAPAGLAFLVLSHPPGRGPAAALTAAALALFFLVVLFWTVAFSGRARDFALRTFGTLFEKVSGRDVSGRLAGLGDTLGRGACSARRRPRLLFAPSALAALDWASSVVALWLCFCALGGRVGAGVLLTGFTVGVVAGLVSLVPGGLGVQDGSMAAVYALLGVPLGEAVLAAVLFRLVYYVVPFLLSLALYRRLLREVEEVPVLPDAR